MMIGLLSVVSTSDTFPAVLIGIPGSVSAQATIMDGFPLAKKGEAARALSAAFASSMIGGVFGAVVLTGAVLVARPIVLAFGTGEMRSEEHTSELQSLMRISYAVFCL